MSNANKPMAIIYSIVTYVFYNIAFNLLTLVMLFIIKLPILSFIFGTRFGIWTVTFFAAHIAKMVACGLLFVVSKYSDPTNILAIRIAGILGVLFYLYMGISAFNAGDIYSNYVIAGIVAASMVLAGSR